MNEGNNEYGISRESLNNIEKLFSSQLEAIEKRIDDMQNTMKEKDADRKKEIESLRLVVEQTNIKVAKIETKLAMWGAGGGALAVLLVKLVEMMIKSKP